MSEGIFPVGRADVATPSADAFKRAASGTAVGTSGVVLGTVGKPGRLYRLMVQNGGATAYYLQIHNKATAPVNTDVPVYVKRIAASSEVEIDLANVNGLPCSLGIGFAISTTPGVLTLAIATDIAFYAATYTQQS